MSCHDNFYFVFWWECSSIYCFCFDAMITNYRLYTIIQNCFTLLHQIVKYNNKKQRSDTKPRGVLFLIAQYVPRFMKNVFISFALPSSLRVMRNVLIADNTTTTTSFKEGSEKPEANSTLLHSHDVFYACYWRGSRIFDTDCVRTGTEKSERWKRSLKCFKFFIRLWTNHSPNQVAHLCW